MAKKQSPLAPNPHSPREVHKNPDPNPLGKKQPPPPPNPNLLAKKRSGAVIKKPNNTQAPANNQEKEEEEEEEETGYETESSEDEEGEEVNQPEAKRPQPISATAAIPALKPRDASEKPNGKDAANGGGDEEGESGSSSSDEDGERLPNTKKARAATPVLRPRDGGGKPNGKGRNAGPKTPFQRIWTLEDEIGILKGMTRFEAEHGPVKINPAGIRLFHDFMRDSLSIEVSDSQLYEKVRRLRRKYERRAANRGKTTRFRGAHDEEVYQLSERIWGAVPGDDTEAKKVAEPERATTVPGGSEGAAGSGSLKRKYPFLLDALGRSLSAGLMETFYDPEDARLLEAHFKKQKVAEIKLKTAAYEKFLEDMKKASTE
ncbi:STOREKEEPER protein-like [Asparagus officinalis]|uniref:STOREKEEPER protein-like n=1 Tax=Asparagus officinalis TaxID=4686 RepID=UPI00098E84E5|nr:STOREKEEPER protein-like [Asparagus officinalis]